MAFIMGAGNARINIDDGGEEAEGRSPVVFVHSLAGNASQWSVQLEHLRKERRAVALDLPGHGRSDPSSDGDYWVETLAKDIDIVARSLDLVRFVLVGHSLGASVSIAYAGENPHRVKGLLLVDPSGDGRALPDEIIEPFLAGLQSDDYLRTIRDYWQTLLVGSGQVVIERVMNDLYATPKDVVAGAFRDSLLFDPVTMHQSYPGPKLSVISHLNSAPYSLHNLVSDLPFIKISGTGHWLQMDRPEEFNRIMDDFLASLDKGEKSFGGRGR